jgi:hypothetical protein
MKADRGEVLMVLIASGSERGLEVVVVESARGMRRSLPSWIQTRLASFSGLSHLGVTFAASMSRNSPSLSERRIHSCGYSLLSSRRR